MTIYKIKRFSSLMLEIEELPFNEENINKFKSRDNMLKHARYIPEKTDGIMLAKGNTLVGYIAWEDDFIIALETSKNFRNQGIASRLLSKANENGANKLSVNKKNKDAIKVYLKLGWKVYDETEAMLFMIKK
jgi:ribosomal protein S18 acetylase RimI-like enzyme